MGFNVFSVILHLDSINSGKKIILPGSLSGARREQIKSIEHPIYMAPAQPNWTKFNDGRRIWPLDGYSIEGARQTDWLPKGVLKYHRTVGTTLNALMYAGLNIRHVQEWVPTAEHVATNPGLAEELDRPMMLLIAAQR